MAFKSSTVAASIFFVGAVSFAAWYAFKSIPPSPPPAASNKRNRSEGPLEQWDRELAQMSGRRIEASDQFVQTLRKEIEGQLPESLAPQSREPIAHLAAEIIRTMGHPESTRINELMTSGSIPKFAEPAEFFRGSRKMIASMHWIYLRDPFIQVTGDSTSVTLSYHVITRAAESNTVSFQISHSPEQGFAMPPQIQHETLTMWPIDQYGNPVPEK